MLHKVRNTLNKVRIKDRKKLAKDLKKGGKTEGNLYDQFNREGDKRDYKEIFLMNYTNLLTQNTQDILYLILII